MPKKYKHKSRGPTRKYDQEQLVKAVNAVKSGSMSIRKAAEQYSVPKSTISDKVTGRNDFDRKPGRSPALPQYVEEKIVTTLKEASKRGMGISRKQLLARTGLLCRRLKVNAFKNGTPGKDWWDGLKKRHPELAIRRPEKLSTSRAQMLNPTIVSKYFDDLENLLENLGIKDQPHRIWNADETGKQFQHNPVKVIAAKGSRNVVGRVTENRTNITIMACVNASGCKMPPMLVVKGKTSRCLHGFNTTEAPERTIWSYQENGWMSDHIGEHWFKDVFLKNCGPERPQILILDGHSSHESLGILELAMQENVHLYCLPPHTTHILQPLDRSVFGPFNNAYNKACSAFLSEHPLHIVNKWSFPTLFRMAWEEGVSEVNIKNGFKACGIFPFSHGAIPVEAFEPAQATDVPLNVAQNLGAIVEGVIEPAQATGVEHTVPLSGGGDAINVSEKSQETDVNINSSVAADDQFNNGSDGAENIAASNVIDGNYLVDDPEELLNLLNDGKLSLFSADENGLVTLSSVENPNEPVATSVDLWNLSVENIFLPPVPEQKKCANRRTKTGHRLLTSNEIIEEKRDAQQRKEQKAVKKNIKKKS